MPITEGSNFTPSPSFQSPGVFTRENDLSGIASGVADIGCVVVAPFPKGPGFSPTIVSSVADLEEKFGVSDGTFYGPYTAKEYLKEKGFVTVSRVGALTGYKQKYPFVIYAEPGSWVRGVSTGTLTSGSSYVLFDSNNISASLNYTTGSSSHPNSGSIDIVAGTSFIGTFSSAALDSGITSVNSTSGSLQYYGQTISFTVPTLTTLAAGTIYVTSSYQGNSSYTPSQKLYRSLVETTATVVNFSASLGNSLTISSSNSGFNYNGTLKLISGSIKSSRPSGGCSTQILLSGIVSGSFGYISASFISENPNGFGDPCNPTFSGSRTPLLLAVLNDTQHATLNSSFESPGFDASVMTEAIVSSSVYSGSFNPTALNYQLDLVTNGSTVGYYDFSLDSSDSKYITNVFGKDATSGNPTLQVSGQKIEAAYLYKIFENTIKKVKNELNTSNGWRIVGHALPSSSVVNGELLNFTDAYSTDLNSGDSQFSLRNAETPWIYSQKVSQWKGSATGTSTAHKYQLFKIHTVSDGTYTNKQYKIEISNVKLAGTVSGTDWGTFTLSVRSFSDTDKRPKYLEIFQNLTMDPDSANFVARRIGDRYNYITYSGKIIEFGDYTNLSRYIRIELGDASYPVTSVPYGFQAYSTPISSTATTWVPTVKYSKASIYGLSVGKYPSGTVMSETPTGADDELQALYPKTTTDIGAYEDTLQYFSPLPSFDSFDNNGSNSDFDLEDTVTTLGTGSLLSPSLSGSIPSTYDSVNEAAYVKMRKFILGFQGGFDGQSPAVPINLGSDIIAGNTQGLNCTNINSAGSIAYKQVIGALGNADEFDINLIVTPGIFHSLHSYVTQLAIDLCEGRGDVFYIMDNIVFPSTNSSVGMIDAAISDVATIDSSYVGTYYPWVKILDTNTNKIINVPPSVLMPSVFAASDAASAPWWAVAGLARGGISQAVGLLDRTTHSDRDTLYNGKVNPIASFPSQGIVVWGQKTLQQEASALDRIGVRRLLIELKKFIGSISKTLVFEQNVSATRNRFLSVVNPFLESVQQRSGLYAFRVIMDETTNTADIIDRGILYGKVIIQPTRTAEYVAIDFNIAATGASFGN